VAACQELERNSSASAEDLECLAEELVECQEDSRLISAKKSKRTTECTPTSVNICAMNDSEQRIISHSAVYLCHRKNIV